MWTTFPNQCGFVVRHHRCRAMWLSVVGQAGHAEVPLDRLGRVFLFGHASMTSPAVDALLSRGVDVHHLSPGGRLKGVTAAADRITPFLRRTQYERFDDKRFSLELARAVVSAKITNRRVLLLRYRRRGFPPSVGPDLAVMRNIRQQLPGVNDLDRLMGFEGAAARAYWGAFAGVVDPGWNFTGRARQPPPDPVNALLSFTYSMLTAEVETAVRAAGLDVGYGFLHAPQDGRPGLVLDLVEEFRHRASGRVVTYREALFLQAAHLARVVAGDSHRYEPDIWS